MPKIKIADKWDANIDKVTGIAPIALGGERKGGGDDDDDEDDGDSSDDGGDDDGDDDDYGDDEDTDDENNVDDGDYEDNGDGNDDDVDYDDDDDNDDLEDDDDDSLSLGRRHSASSPSARKDPALEEKSWKMKENENKEKGKDTLSFFLSSFLSSLFLLFACVTKTLDSRL